MDEKKQKPDDDEAWLSGLLGEQSPRGTHQREGATIRRVIRAHAYEQAQRIADADSAEWEQLLFRLKTEGLLKEEGKSTRLPFTRGPNAAMSLAASIAAIGIIVGYGALVPQEVEVQRSASADLIVPDPTVVADELREMTKTIGGEMALYRRCNGVVELELPNTPEVLTELREVYALTPNAALSDRRLSVQIAPTRPKSCSPTARLRDRMMKIYQRLSRNT
jgi:hypothetical protein